MDILSGEYYGFVFFVDVRNEINSRIRDFSFVSCRQKQQYIMNRPTGWKEIAGDMLEPRLKDTYSQETSTWKGHNNRIWFQTKDDVMMELDRIWYVEYKSRN